MEPSDQPPPWSIPVREPDADIPQRYATWIDRLPVLPMAAAVVVLFAVVVAALVVLDGDPAQSGPEVVGAGMRSDDLVDGTVATTMAVTSSAPSTTAATTTTASTTTSEATQERAAPAPAGAPADPEPADLPIHTPGDLGGGWVAQVSSVPSSAGGAALSRSYETVRRAVADAMIVRGSEWASLRDGFWVIFHPGYDDASAAVAACEAWGFDGKDECFARYLSADDATQRTCWRDESGSLAGACS